MQVENLYSGFPSDPGEEWFDVILENANFRIERIVSNGQCTPPGEWLDQERGEWVVLLKGSAGIRFKDSERTRQLRPGDHIHVPAHVQHRVEWTSDHTETVWLAIHYGSERG